SALGAPLSLPARAFGRSAAARRSRARADPEAERADRRRARLRSRRLRAGVDPQPSARPPARDGFLVPVHHARSRNGRVPVRPRRRDVSRQARRARAARGALREPAAPLHAGAALRRRRARPGGAANAQTDRARGRCAEPARATVRMPVPHAVPARTAFGAPVVRGGAAAHRVHPRASRRMPSRLGRTAGAASRRGTGEDRVMAFTTRPELRGTFGMVASTHWLASAAGMAVLEHGGNAFDAAVATGFTLQVVEPHLNGPGGDLPALVWPAGRNRPLVLCAQGPAPRAATIERYRDELGLALVPGTGPLAAVVPGAFGGWLALLREHGTMELADVL